jgi:hypothetical protein
MAVGGEKILHPTRNVKKLSKMDAVEGECDSLGLARDGVDGAFWQRGEDGRWQRIAAHQ